MAVILATNLLSGTTGLDKSVIMTANLLHQAGYPISLINFIGPGDGSKYLMPTWALNPGIPLHPLQTLPAAGGKYFPDGVHPLLAGRIKNLNYSFTKNQFAAMNQLNDNLNRDDMIIFTHPLQVQVFGEGLAGRPRNCRTMLQIHGDYHHGHPELWEIMQQERQHLDKVQIMVEQMRPGYRGLFADADIELITNTFVPGSVTPVAHDGINLILAGSFQPRKNQLDAVRMMQLITNPRVRLTLWGNNANAYGRHVQRVIGAYGLGDRVRVAGVGSESEVYAEADILISTSRNEGMNYTLAEAGAHRLPIVTYDYQFGPRFVVSDGSSGFIVPLGDIAAMAQRIDQLAADPKLRRQFGEAGRQSFEATFSEAAVLREYDQVLGPAKKRAVDLNEIFPAPNTDPLPTADIRTRTAALGRRGLVSLVSIPADSAIENLQISDGTQTRPLRTVKSGRRRWFVVARGLSRRLRFWRAKRKVVTYTDAQGRNYYLGNSTRRGHFEVARFLRLDADYDPAPNAFSVVVDALIVPRHPRQPVTSGRDNFGSLINAPFGMTVLNVGNVLRPEVKITGEWDSVELFDGIRNRRFSAPYGYGELFERVLDAERTGGFFDIVEADFHPWELFRGAFIALLCEALGLWGKQFAANLPPVWDSYSGPNQLETAGPYRRIVFEFPRKPTGTDQRTARFQDPDSMIIEYPQVTGYSAAADLKPNYFPIQPYLQWKAQKLGPRAKWVDPRPFETGLTAALGFPVILGNQLTHRAQKFLDEREFWTPVFSRVRPEEVIVPSSHWSAGICAAAREVGAVPSDIQYALTGKYHPSYWFGERPRHGASRLYAWSQFWGERTNAFSEISLTPRAMDASSGAAAAQRNPDFSPQWDFCVISQPRVSRRLLDFTRRLADAHPQARICLAPHPDETRRIAAAIAAAGLTGRVSVATAGTTAAMRGARVCLGGYSTSMYEAAAEGIPTYVVPVPGYEILKADIASGLFRLAADPSEVVPFAVPEVRRTIFAS